MTESTIEFTPQEQAVEVAQARNTMSIGLPRCYNASERRFPLTPETVRILTDAGYRIKMEEGASKTIHYTDAQYTRQGAEIVTHDEAVGCDIVIQLAAPSVTDARKMKRGAMLLTFLNLATIEAAVVRELMARSVTAVAIDLIEDSKGNTPFADILAEIDGRAAIAIASSLLADAVHGKGILLGGIAGIVPCEVLIIGSNDTACSAARSASGQGAIVRMMDNDVYRLRRAMRELGSGIIASSIHPRGLASALRTADVVVYTDVESGHTFNLDDVDTMKRGVISFDLSQRLGKAFPSMPAVNLADSSALDNSFAAGTRVCYINAGSAVPRTAAMALSNTFVTLFDEVAKCGSALNALKLTPGMQCAAFTFMGRVVNPAIAEMIGERASSISLYLTLS